MKEKDSKKVKGGEARAKSLTAHERKAIAQKAALARWNSDIPIAKYGSSDHPLKIGAMEIPCYVLEDGRRVLVQAGMMTALNMKQGTAGRGQGDRLAKFTATKSISPYVSKELRDVIIKPISFRTGRSLAYGYEATVLADLCDAVLDARELGKINYQQKHIAKQCEILVRGFARVGIVALVDEATGYQEVRDRKALQTILDKYITNEWAKWTKTFPDEFYKELFRLKGLKYPVPGGKKPQYVGHWTNNIIYSRLAPGVKDALKKKNPREPKTGNRKAKDHQFLTRDYGHPELRELLSNVIFMMRACSNFEEFEVMLNKTRQKHGNTIEMNV